MDNNVAADSGYQDQRIWAIVAYILHLFGVLAFPSIVALILNYLRRDQAHEILQTHHSWMIRTFWWALLWVLISAVTWFLVIGVFVAAAVWLWWMYRIIRGLIYLADNKPMPA